MQAASATAETILDRALQALRTGGGDLEAALDALPAPIYTTDAEGRITFYNRACVDFAGRTPEIGADRWCVTWRLYRDDGSYLPHDQCPMALAIREQRPVRGLEAFAERPDGSRVRFLPYPTPLFGEDGALEGAVNLLVDVSGREQAKHLRNQALRCRRLARGIGDQPTIDTLKAMAEEYEEQARSADPLS